MTVGTNVLDGQSLNVNESRMCGTYQKTVIVAYCRESCYVVFLSDCVFVVFYMPSHLDIIWLCQYVLNIRLVQDGCIKWARGYAFMLCCISYYQDDNNPFSESFQQRERMEKLRQQEEQRIQMQRHLEQQHTADQPEHEMTAGKHDIIIVYINRHSVFQFHCLVIHFLLGYLFAELAFVQIFVNSHPGQLSLFLGHFATC